MTYRSQAEIRGYHAHVYFDPSTREAAAGLRDAIGAAFTVELGRLHDKPIGPHPQGMFEVAFAPDQLAQLLPWLVLNRGPLAVMVHPRTGDELADHASHPLWLGTPLPLDLDFIRRYIGVVSSRGLG